MYFSLQESDVLELHIYGNMCSTWRELDLGQWKESVLKDFLYRHSAPVGLPPGNGPGDRDLT